MMEIVVPLAGPDFELGDGSTKAEILSGEQPLLLRTLTSRSWWRRGEASDANMVFVLRDTACSRKFADGPLRDWFPGARKSFLSHSTQGAALSALAGVALCDPERPLCVDLADIIYDDDIQPVSLFKADARLGGILPVFKSKWPLYSYAVLAPDGTVTRTAEKEVISDLASAGTYFFRDASVFFSALSYVARRKADNTYNGLFFVCPLFNGVVAAGHDVRVRSVADVVDIKQEFPPSVQASA